MIQFHERLNTVRIPENKLFCYETIVIDEIYQRVKHTILKDTFCCITLKVNAKCSQIYRDPSPDRNFLNISPYCVQLKYEYIAFKASVGDVVHGSVLDICKDGIKISFAYCHDLFMPFTSCATFSETENADWTEQYKIGELINFRITHIRFDEDKLNSNGVNMWDTWFKIYGKVI